MARKKLRCYIYTRVSTELQIDGYSLEAQKERLKREAKHRGMQIVGEYSDEGKSGKNINGRPEFKQMLADLVAREEKYLQVNSEEFNRRHRELMELIERASRKE